MRKKTIHRTPPTPEQVADAERLRGAYKAAGHGLTQAEFGEKFHIGSQSMVWQYLSGTVPLNARSASEFARALGCKVSDFSPRLAAEIEAMHQAEAEPPDADEFAQVRRVDVTAAAGHGSLVLEEFSHSALAFRRSFLREVGVTPSSAVIIDVKGHSMDPTIRDGSVLLLSTGARTVVSGAVYAFRLDGHLLVKRLHQLPGGGVRATSDNPDRDTYPDLVVGDGATDFEIIGRALWVGARL